MRDDKTVREIRAAEGALDARPKTASVTDSLSRMEIIAHRGASHDAPENTLAAARLAWRQGADALECDVQLTADGRLAVMHDDDTRRVTGGAQALAPAGATLDQLRALDVGAWKHADFAGEKIPALDELLRTVPAGKRIFIEVKNGPEAIPELVRCLARCTLVPAQVAVISFQLEAARAAKRALSRCEVCYLAERDAHGVAPPLDAVIAAACAAELDGLDLEAAWPVEARVVQRVRDAGLKLYVWTVDDPMRARELAALGIDGITTNRPEWLRMRLAGSAGL